MNKFTTVSIKKIESNVEIGLKDCLNLQGGINNFIKKGDIVFIKPNLTAGYPSESGATTDVRLVECLAKLVKTCNPKKIIVGEGAGTEIDTRIAFDKLGYRAMAERTGVELLDCDRDKYVNVEVKDALYKQKFKVAQILLYCDVFISVPVLKPHSFTGITVALKNSFGLIPDKDKIEVHRSGKLEEAIVDINSVRAADLIVVDGLVAAEGIAGGSDFSHPIRRNLIIMGQDPVATDAICVKLMDHNPRILHIRWAAEKGIGIDDLAYIQTNGLRFKEAVHHFLTPREQLIQEKKNLNLLDLNSCSGCRSIVESSLNRFSQDFFLKPVTIAYGPGELSLRMQQLTKQKVILVGDCTKRYQTLGKWIPGCPPQFAELYKVLNGLGLACNKCADSLQLAMKDLRNYPAFLEKLRILGGGQEIYRGASNEAGMEDLVFLIGDCEKGYSRYHGNRLKKILRNKPFKYMAYVRGCPPSPEQIKRSFHTFLRRTQGHHEL